MMFFTHKEIYGEYFYIKNSSTFKVLDVGKIILNKTSKKLITHNNTINI